MRKSGSLQIGDASGKWLGSTFSPFLLPSATLPPASASSHPRPTDRPRSFLFHYILPHFTSLAGFASTEQRGEKMGGTERGTEGEREREDRTRRRLASSHNSARLSSGGEALSAAAAAAADRKSYVFHSTSSSVQIGERTRSKSVVVLVTPCPPA